MAIAITGASGVIGSALAADLLADGTTVVRLVRRAPDSPDEIEWDPRRRWVDIDGLLQRGVTAVVNLAGAGVADRRWTASYKKDILSSRVDGTATMAAAVAQLPDDAVLVNGSAIGYYGDTGSAIVDESGPMGSTFLAHVVREWEAAASDAESAGRRVVLARTGLVASLQGGAIGKMLPFFKAGLGGRIGSGRQWWSIISIADEVRALRFAIDNDSLEGPVNLVAPEPVTNAEVTRALAEALHRPAALVIPKLALRAYLGGFAEDVVMSLGVRPAKLTESGFEWLHPTIERALAALDL